MRSGSAFCFVTDLLTRSRPYFKTEEKISGAPYLLHPSEKIRKVNMF
jgi:hypothetical protein